MAYTSQTMALAKVITAAAGIAAVCRMVSKKEPFADTGGKIIAAGLVAGCAALALRGGTQLVYAGV